MPDQALLIGDAARAVVAIAAPDEAPHFDQLSAAFFAEAGMSSPPGARPAAGSPGSYLPAGLITGIVIATLTAMLANPAETALAEVMPPITAERARLEAQRARQLAIDAGVVEAKAEQLGAAVFAILLQGVAQ